MACNRAEVRSEDNCPDPPVTQLQRLKLSFGAASTVGNGGQVKEHGSSPIFHEIQKAMEEGPNPVEEPLLTVTQVIRGVHRVDFMPNQGSEFETSLS